MSKPDDSELERFLAGDHPVSAHYRDAADEAPPPELDAAIRRQAHDAVSGASGRRRRWLRPVAAAAVLVLGVGLVFDLQRQPELQPAAVPASSGSAELAAPQQRRSYSAPAAKQRPAPAPESAVQSRPQTLAQPEVRAPAADRLPVQPTVDAQIAHIRQLVEADQRDAAVTALKRLLEQHPNVTLPGGLARLAQTEGLTRFD